MADFVIDLLDLVFFLFDKTDNIIIFVPTFVLFFCFTFALIRRLMRGGRA